MDNFDTAPSLKGADVSTIPEREPAYVAPSPYQIPCLACTPGGAALAGNEQGISCR